MQPGVVSVMMPAYNAAQYIGQAINSLLAQTYPYWELILVNDGSTDETADVIAQFTDPRIRVIHQSNGGEAAARNTALRQLQGEFLAFLDADDCYLPHHLAVTVGYLQAHPDRQGVYTDGYYCNPEGERLRSLSSRRRGPFEGFLFEEAVRASDLFGPPLCVVLRSAVIQHFHLSFDETITIGPDWVFLIEVAEKAQFGYLDPCTCLYRVHNTNITARVGLRNRALELAKCRIRAIQTANFQHCSVTTRTAVFYDLLVNLLRGDPERQSAITQWPEFHALPRPERAKLLRLMASQTLLYEQTQGCIGEWLRQAQELNPADRYAAFLSRCYGLSPFLCKVLLRVKKHQEIDPLTIPPFADLHQR